MVVRVQGTSAALYEKAPASQSGASRRTRMDMVWLPPVATYKFLLKKIV